MSIRHKTQLNVKVMENLSKDVIINELNVKKAVLKEIEKKIKNKSIHNEALWYYKWLYETQGAIDMLKYLLTKFEEND